MKSSHPWHFTNHHDWRATTANKNNQRYPQGRVWKRAKGVQGMPVFLSFLCLTYCRQKDAGGSSRICFLTRRREGIQTYACIFYLISCYLLTIPTFQDDEVTHPPPLKTSKYAHFRGWVLRKPYHPTRGEFRHERISLPRCVFLSFQHNQRACAPLLFLFLFST